MMLQEAPILMESPRVNLRSALLVGALVASIGIFISAFAFYANHARDVEDERAARSGQTALANCQQIEALKDQVRAVLVNQGVENEARRFEPRNCYDLPTVKAAGIKPPPKKQG